MNLLTKLAMGVIGCTALAMPALAQNVVVNPSFEDRGPFGDQPFFGWTPFGNAFIEAVFPRTGAVSAKMFGNFTGGENATGCFQDFATQPGDEWRASAYFAHITGDAMSEENFAALNIEWRDAFGDLISFESVTALNASSTIDTYQLAEISGIAPAGAVTARCVVLFIQPLFAGGAAYIDDVSFEIVTGPSCPACAADFDQSGGVDGDDIGAFFEAWTLGAECADVDNSGGVDGDDIPAFFGPWTAGGC